MAASVGAAAALVAVFPGVAGAIPISGTVDVNDPAVSSTVDISAASSCAAPVTPQVVSLIVHYDVYAFTNTTATPQCVAVTVSSATGQGVLITAYAAGVDFATSPGNVLGTSGDCFTGPGSFSFMAPPGGFNVVVEECGQGTGSSTYAADVSGTGIVAGAVAAVLRGAPTATAGASGVTVRWRTASQVGVVGFNVYRQVNGVRKRVNSRLIAARGGEAGRAYSFRDRRAPAAKRIRYWIQAVNADGSRTWLAPTAFTRRPARSTA